MFQKVSSGSVEISYGKIKNFVTLVSIPIFCDTKKLFLKSTKLYDSYSR